jgi:cobalt-precorrin 5A hydrolase/precorrin-3B C17-methyltransferase
MSLVLGVGVSTGVDALALQDLIGVVLRDHGLDPRDVTDVVTLDDKTQAVPVRRLAAAMGARVTGYPPSILAAQDVPHPSPAVRLAVTTPSVAEAAVLAAGARLVVPKTVRDRCTVAVGVSHRADLVVAAATEGR